MAARKKAVVNVEEVKAVAEETVKAVTDKAEEVVKEVKKTTTRKTPAKKPAKKAEPEVNVFVEYMGKQAAAKEVVARAMDAYKAAHADAEIKTFEVYVKPEENAAYYVVNGEGSVDFKVEL